MCSGMRNRALIDDGSKWILQGDERERENRAAGVKALHSISGRAKELVKQGLSERNGMIAFKDTRAIRWSGETLRTVPVDKG